MYSENKNLVSSFLRKLTRVFLMATLAITGLAAALPQPAQATPDAPAGAVGAMSAARAWHTASLLSNGKVLVLGGRNDTGRIGSAELYNITTGAWSGISGVSPARQGHTATTLLNGKVLVVGGYSGASVLNNAALYDPVKNAWTAAANLSTGRYNHTATLLEDGSVLVVGGEDLSDAPVATAERYDPVTDTWSSAGTLNAPRWDHTATLLPGGWVLVAGGQDGIDILDTAELYSPADNAWTSVTDTLSSPRLGHSATVLPDGQVLIAGGENNDGSLDSAELFTFVSPDEASSTWTDTGGLVVSSRTGHSATLLPNGKVMVVGGFGIDIADPTAPAHALGSIELYDPAANTWTGGGFIQTSRSRHTATLLPTGEVLIAGGLADTGYLTSVEKVDLTTGEWTPTGNMATDRLGHTATLLTDGTVLVTGGFSTEGIEVGFLSSSERYNVGLDDWLATGTMNAVRGNHSATLLPNGQVLVAGGLNSSPQPPKTSELYDPTAGTWSPTGLMSYAHYFHSAKLLPNGKVLVAGGVDETGPIAICEVYDPTTAQWQLVHSMSTPRQSFSATILHDGRILVAGGQNIDPLSSAEVYDIGQGFLPAWRPAISGIPPRIKIGEMLTIAGTNFRGYQQIEASSGSTHESPSNYPLVQLRRPDNGQVAWLSPDPRLGFSGTVFNSMPLGFPTGPVIVTVYVNGIPSQSVMIQIDALKVFTPIVFKADPRPYKVRLPIIKR